MGEFSFTDDSLHESALLITDAMLESASSSAECAHKFTASFEARMTKLLLKAKRTKPLHALQRIAVIFLAVLLSSTTFLAVNTEARAAFARWTLEIFGDTAIYRFFSSPQDSPIPSYRLTWFPGDYDILDANKDEDSNVIIYGTPENEAILFYYHILHESQYLAITSLNGEEIEPETVSIHGASGDFYDLSADGLANSLVWVDSKANIIFVIDAFCDRDTLVKIAESMEPGETPSPFPNYIPAWLPEGYSKNGERGGFRERTMDYKNGEQELSFSASLTEETQLSTVFDLAASDNRLLEMNGYEAAFIPGNDGMNRLCWLDAKAGIAFEIVGPEELGVLKKMAENLVLVD